MTGPEHYKEAERLLRSAKRSITPSGKLSAEDMAKAFMADVASAQVHATLALAAATALNDHDGDGGGLPAADWKAWHAVAGTKPEGATS